MKIFQSAIFRAFCAIITGILLVANPGAATKLLVVFIGLLFMIPGVVTIILYFRFRSQSGEHRPLFPLVGLGSVLMGGLLVAFPTNFVTMLMYVLGAFLIVAASNQLAGLYQLRKAISLSPLCYITPVIIILIATVMIVHPLEAVFTILGTMTIVYGLSEFYNVWQVRKSISYHKSQKSVDSATEAQAEEIL